MSGPLDPLSTRASAMLDTLSAYEQDDAAVIAVMRSTADELDRVVGVAEAARDQAWPSRADDTYGLLGMHERLMGLPVAPPGVSVTQRQAALAGAVRARRSGRRTDWIDRMTTLLGTDQWTWAKIAPNVILVTIPSALGDYGTALVEQRARRFTPAHVQLQVAYSGDFIFDYSPMV